MKKIIAFMLSFVLMFSFCACGNTETNKNEPVEAFTDIVVIDNEQCSFVITSAPYEDAIWGQLIDVRLENKKPLEENTGSMLFGISISNRFFFFFWILFFMQGQQK